MKKILFIFLVFFAITACKKDNASSKIDESNLEKAKSRDENINQGAAEISFDKTEYDFGTVTEGEVVQTTFVVTNTGKTDLVIINAQPSCGCTVPTWPQEPIKPGKTGAIKVEFDTTGKPNKQSKTVTLTTNTKTGSEVLTVKGSVLPKK